MGETVITDQFLPILTLTQIHAQTPAMAKLGGGGLFSCPAVTTDFIKLQQTFSGPRSSTVVPIVLFLTPSGVTIC